MALADTYDGRDAKGHYSNVLDAFLAIGCIDGLRTVDPAQLDELRDEDRGGGPVSGHRRPARGVKDPCAFWPVPPTTTAHVPQVAGCRGSWSSPPPTIRRRPYQAGVNLAKDAGARRC